MAEMTSRQARYLAYIRAYRDGFKLSPSETEIAKAIGVTAPSVSQMLKTLEKNGLIRRQPGVPRSIEILVADDAIPKWVGKRITRTVWEWVPDSPKAGRSERSSGNKETIYCFKITLRDTHPAIWRRIETKDVTLKKLHELIQTAMGWTNSHMHQFEVMNGRKTNTQKTLGGSGELVRSSIRISELVAEHGSNLRLGYIYDFGDSWEHDIVLEKLTEAEPGAKYPRCIDGKRACPPENVGGVCGFANYVEAVTNPDHSDHEDLLDWNGPFDPESFDPAKATQRMKKGLPSW